VSGYDVQPMDIDGEYLRFQASRSGGPGGQNVNKVNTRVTVYFDLAAYPLFSDAQKRRIREKLATRTNSQGIIRVTSQRFRTQLANRKAAAKRLMELLEGALKRPRIRIRTGVPRGTREQRLEHKKRRGQLKQLRSRKPREHD
jgi:ribosome-associated protein